MNWKRSWVPILLAAFLWPALALLAACASTSPPAGPHKTTAQPLPAASMKTASVTGDGLRFSMEYPAGPYATNTPYPVRISVTNKSTHAVTFDGHLGIFSVSVHDGAGRELFDFARQTGRASKRGAFMTVGLQPGKSYAEQDYFELYRPGVFVVDVHRTSGTFVPVLDQLKALVSINPTTGPSGDSYTAAGTGGGFGLRIVIPRALRARHPVAATATLTNLTDHPLPLYLPSLGRPFAWVTARDARGRLEAWNLIPAPPYPDSHGPGILLPRPRLAPSQSLTAEVTLLPTTRGPIELAVDYPFMSDPDRAFNPATRRPKGLPLILHVVVR